MNLCWADLRVLYHLLLKPSRGGDHAARMESFYAGQADGYDRFRERLLPGRRELYRTVPLPTDGVWVDLGGGTGANFDALAERIPQLRTAYVVDLSPSLWRWPAPHSASRLEERTYRAGRCHGVSAARRPSGRRHLFLCADDDSRLVRCHRERLCHAEAGRCCWRRRLLCIAQTPGERRATRHSWPARSFWPAWFAGDNVFLSPDHLPFLRRHFEEMFCTEGMTKLPYLPLIRVPYYTFMGRKRFPPASANVSGP